MDRRVSHVIASMRSNLRGETTLAAMARTVNVTPEHLCRMFKAETGVSPAKYFKRLKMREAARLLSDTFLSIKEVMVAVGLKDESHFVRDFKMFHGLTPTQYRLRVKRENLRGSQG